MLWDFLSSRPILWIVGHPAVVEGGKLAAHSFAKLFSRFHWVSLLSAVLMAWVAWAYQRRQDRTLAGKGFLVFLFPRDIWLHRSALLDYRFVLFDKLALALVIGLGGIVIGPAAQKLVHSPHLAVQSSIGMVIAYTICLLLVEDFCRYWAHRWMHEVPVLWHFHKVHHSPEVLVPISELRNHPVNGIVNLTRSAIAVPLVTGLFLLFFPGKLSVATLFGVNAGRFIFNMLGAQLRHSHIWVDFGPWLSRVVISPAQHQIHHSRAKRHWDRNYGSQFALWDWMFGTLYLPQRREPLDFGIDRRDTERMQTVKALYLQPFRDAWSEVEKWRQGRARPVLGT